MEKRKLVCKRIKITALTFMMGLMMSPIIHAQAILEGDRSVSVESKSGMVVTSHTLATKDALEVLKNGGNAIDAAVTAAFSLAVTQPRSGNIGGGGFMLVSSETKDEVVAIDYRERAPSAATGNMFLDADGNVDPTMSRYSHRAVGVPGTVAGLALALEKYGTISLQSALAPAIKLAEEGFIVTPRFSKGIKAGMKRMKAYDSTRKIFFKANGSAYEPGDRFVQKDLAETLRRISQNGVKEF